jgi:AcrR family transcriptional regulator
LNHALILFNEKGFQNITTGEIAKKSGVARTTFYEYFKSKNDILVKLIQPIVLQARAVEPLGESCYEQLRYLTFHSLRVIYENKQIYRIIYQELHNVQNEDLQNDFTRLTKIWTDQITQVFLRGVEKGEITDLFPVDEFILIYQSTLRGLGTLFTFGDYGMDELSIEVNKMLSILFEGFKPRS